MGFDYTCSVHVIHKCHQRKKGSSVTQVTNHGLDNTALREILKTRRAKRGCLSAERCRCRWPSGPSRVSACGTSLHNLAGIVHPEDRKMLMTHTNFYSMELTDTTTHMEVAFTRQVCTINDIADLFHVVCPLRSLFFGV